MENPNDNYYNEIFLENTETGIYDNVEGDKPEEDAGSLDSYGWYDDFDDGSDHASVHLKHSAAEEMEDLKGANEPIYCTIDEMTAEKRRKFTDKNDRYEIPDLDEIVVEKDDNVKLLMLNKLRKQKIMKGHNFLNLMNNPDQIPEHATLRNQKTNVFKTFEKIHRENMIISLATCGNNTKLRTLWFLRILSLILAVSFLLVYFNTKNSVHHIHHIFSWNIH
uniref:AsIV-cont00032-ORF1 n=1 Tax=Apophua simplicipes ichnovirus TaxID=1329648 RepID=S5DSY7_9VIRU|nr:AsIV-cont00032-ORF1 [Apophua simplicipes ichnovirus]